MDSCEGAEKEDDCHCQAKNVSSVVILFRGGLLRGAEQPGSYTFAEVLTLLIVAIVKQKSRLPLLFFDG